MNKKGFTLIELIAMIIILSIITILSFSSLTKTLKNTQLKEIEDYKSKVEAAAQLYIEPNLDEYPGLTTGSSIKLDIYELVSSGYLKDDIEVKDKCTFEKTQIIVKKNEDNTITYNILCDAEVPPVEIVYNKSDIVYFDPINNTKCTDYTEANSATGVKTGCMKWYVYKDNGNGTYQLILDHNTTAEVAYNSENVNTSMKEVATTLTSDTSTWDTSLNTRLIKADEIAAITNNTTFNSTTTTSSGLFYLDSNNQTQTANATTKSNYAWLYDYTYDCTTYGCNIADSSTYGYWTDTAVSGSTSDAWSVFRSGYLDINNVSDASSGVRPVITF